MKRYELLYRGKGIFDECKTVAEMADNAEHVAKELRELADAGIKLDGPVGDDYAFLVTTNKSLAKKHQMHEQQ